MDSAAADGPPDMWMLPSRALIDASSVSGPVDDVESESGRPFPCDSSTRRRGDEEAPPPLPASPCNPRRSHILPPTQGRAAPMKEPMRALQDWVGPILTGETSRARVANPGSVVLKAIAAAAAGAAIA